MYDYWLLGPLGSPTKSWCQEFKAEAAGFDAAAAEPKPAEASKRLGGLNRV